MAFFDPKVAVDESRKVKPTITTFEKYEVASWKVGGSAEYKFPVMSIDEDGGNRIVRHNRPFRDGAKLDDTGSNATVWRVAVCFNNSLVPSERLIGEPGIPAGTILYPHTMNGMLETVGRHETGDLVLPTRGGVRARLESYSRRESYDKIDTADLTFVFVEDNEDSVDASSYAAPSVAAQALTLQGVAKFSNQSAGGWDGSLQQLTELVGEIEGLSNLPDKYAAEYTEKIHILKKLTKKSVDAFSKPWVEGRDTLNDPENSRAARSFVDIGAALGISAQDSRRNRPAYQFVVFERDQSLASIAAMLAQSYTDLLAINEGIIEDPVYIPAGELVRVFVDAA